MFNNSLIVKCRTKEELSIRIYSDDRDTFIQVTNFFIDIYRQKASSEFMTQLMEIISDTNYMYVEVFSTTADEVLVGLRFNVKSDLNKRTYKLDSVFVSLDIIPSGIFGFIINSLSSRRYIKDIFHLEFVNV